MVWTFQEIEGDWLQGSRLALSPEAVVEAFNRVEAVLGRNWMESSRMISGVVCRGSSPTLYVVTIGQQLAVLQGLNGAEELIENVRRGEHSAVAELTAIFLLRTSHPSVVVELFPTVAVKSSERRPDFRVRQHNGPWVYVEVTQPDWSEAQKRATAILERLSGLVSEIKKPLALEIFLRREPTDDEIAMLNACVREICKLDMPHREELPSAMGILVLNHSQPGRIHIADHTGEENQPRLSMAKTIVGLNEPHRHLAVRMAFADQRAEAFLTTESKQLPTDAPALVMVQMSRAPGGFRSWEPLLRRRLQPTQHTRVSAVCLFSSGLNGTSRGEAWLPETKLLLNPHCKLPLPLWLAEALRHIRAGFERALGVACSVG